MLHTHHIAFGSFWTSAALIVVALLYLRRWVRIRGLNLESVAGWRVASFVLGLLLIWIAMASPLAALDHEMLTAHMVQHLLLMTLAPPLILLGTLQKPPVHGLMQRCSQVIGRPLRSEPMRQFLNVVTHPVFCWFAAAGALVVWHIPSVFMLGLRS